MGEQPVHHGDGFSHTANMKADCPICTPAFAEEIWEEAYEIAKGIFADAVERCCVPLPTIIRDVIAKGIAVVLVAVRRDRRAAPPADGEPSAKEETAWAEGYRRGLEEAAIAISEVRGSGSTVDECMRVIRARAAATERKEGE